MSWRIRKANAGAPVSGKVARLTSNEQLNKRGRGRSVRPARPVVRDRKHPRKGM